jgi:Skp family chaperone for outer membrane proteins
MRVTYDIGEPTMRLLMTLVFLMVAIPGHAQTQPGDAVQIDQQKAGMAFRELRRAEGTTTQAEQEYRQADADFKAAQKRADELKAYADTLKKKAEAAKANEVQARKKYDAAVNAVGRDAQPAPKK